MQNKPPRIRPINHQVLVEEFKPVSVTKGGILLPDVAQKRQQRARVIAVGPGRRNRDGGHDPMDVKPGEIVVLRKYHGTDVIVDHKPYMFVTDEEILCVEEG